MTSIKLKSKFPLYCVNHQAHQKEKMRSSGLEGKRGHSTSIYIHSKSNKGAWNTFETIAPMLISCVSEGSHKN